MSLGSLLPKRVMSPRWVMVIICLGVFTAALDQTVVVTALPTIMADLKLEVPKDASKAAWIITSYIVGYTVAMPLFGRIADVYGYARIYQASLVVFIIGTCFVALADNLPWIIGARVVQAVGGGATVPISMAIATTVLPASQRGMAIGLVVASAEAGSLLGPAYGGAIIELLDWRWIFWLNAPQAALIMAALVWLPSRRQPDAKVDWQGGILLAGVLFVLTFALSREGLFTLTSLEPFLVGAPGLALVGVLALVERRKYQPLLEPALLRTRAFITANATQLLEGVSLIIAMVTIPLMANTVMERDPLTGGWWLLRLTGASAVGALLGGYLLNFVGNRAVAISGLLISATGLALVSTWQIDIAEPWLTIHLCIAGVGYGLNNTPLMARALSSVDEGYRATAASLVTVSRMIGMASALLPSRRGAWRDSKMLTAELEFPAQATGPAIEAYFDGVADAGLTLFHSFLRISATMAVLAVVPAFLMRATAREVAEREMAGRDASNLTR